MLLRVGLGLAKPGLGLIEGETPEMRVLHAGMPLWCLVPVTLTSACGLQVLDLP